MRHTPIPEGELVALIAREERREAWRDALVEVGFSVRSISEVSDAARAVAVVIDVATADRDAVLAGLRVASPAATVVAVATDHAEVDAYLERGVDDVVLAGARAAELVARLRRRLADRQLGRALDASQRSAMMLLELTRSLASNHDLGAMLFLVLRRLAEAIHVDRASIVLGRPGDTDASVVASSDDEELRELRVRLAHYPEMARVLETGEPIFVEDVVGHPLMELPGVAVPRRFRALTLFPIRLDHEPVGVLFLRFDHPRILGPADRFALEAVANAAGIALRNASLVERVVEHREHEDRLERRHRALQRYVDYFESSADGILVLGRDGEVLFANPAAQAITGHSSEEIARRPWSELVAPQGGDLLRALTEQLERGEYPIATDVPTLRADGKQRVLNVSFSPLHDAQGLIVSFRDVTRERSIAQELIETKEFLQRVIDSSVDAIVAADMRGRVQLFNPAAERIYGWAASEIVGGGSNVRRLYPPGEAREIMRRIRSDEHGEVGVLQGYETHLLHRDGSLIPVILSAALIDVGGTPVGTVGVFHDLRDTLAIEAQLAQTRDELAEREQKAFIVELAGATAHELNQPLTSILGYGGLLERRIEDPQLARAVRIILREAERMAEIVRKIGRLTKFESKPYVGHARILDLEAAVDSERARDP